MGCLPVEAETGVHVRCVQPAMTGQCPRTRHFSEGGVFKAHLTFPKDYPLRPPKMKFITEIWHPNVDKNGDVCISILHEPGEDKYGYEKPEERWLPIHTVETIMISVISMLADPNGDSPANVDAAKEWREDRNGEFKRKVARCVRKSQETAFE